MPISTGLVRVILQEERVAASGYQLVHRLDEIKLDHAEARAYLESFLVSGNRTLLKRLDRAVARIDEHWTGIRGDLRKLDPAAESALQSALMAETDRMQKAVDLRLGRGGGTRQYSDEQATPAPRVADLLDTLQAAQVSRMQLLQDQRDAAITRTVAIGSLLAAVLIGGLGWLYWLTRRTELGGRQAVASLRASEERFRSLIKLTADWYWEEDEQARFIFLSAEADWKQGYERSRNIGLTRRQIVGTDIASADWDAHEAVYQARQPFKNFTYRRVAGDGSVRWIRTSGEPVFDDSGGFKGYRGIASDITRQRLSEQELVRQKDLYAALSQTNRAIIHVHEPQPLFDEVCRVAVEHGHFCLAWIGLVEEGGWIVPKTIHGPVSDVYRRMRVSVDPEIPEGRGFAGAAVRDNRSYVVNDFLSEPRVAPWREQAQAAGVRSLATFPLRQGGNASACSTCMGTNWVSSPTNWSPCSRKWRRTFRLH